MRFFLQTGVLGALLAWGSGCATVAPEQGILAVWQVWQHYPGVKSKRQTFVFYRNGSLIGSAVDGSEILGSWNRVNPTTITVTWKREPYLETGTWHLKYGTLLETATQLAGETRVIHDGVLTGTATVEGRRLVE
jgi:hypothetical protein